MTSSDRINVNNVIKLLWRLKSGGSKIMSVSVTCMKNVVQLCTPIACPCY